MAAEWVVERTAHPRLPFRIRIIQGDRTLLSVQAAAPWPGPGQNIFCLPDRLPVESASSEVIERAAVLHLARVGRKLTVALDRGSRKRCEFLSVERPGRDGQVRRQLFFRTESAIRAHRSRTRAELVGDGPVLTVVIDSAERYPWRFPGAVVRRRRLMAGDYALLQGERVTATVERKSLDNLLGDIGALQALHQQLALLAAQPSPALVIEAQYADFLDDHHVGGRWPVAYLARVLAELAALHPALPIVYAGNRKLANLWCQRFFTACALRDTAPQLELVREAIVGYHAEPVVGVDEQIRQAVHAIDGDFSVTELRRRFPDVPAPRIARVLQRLRAEGRLVAVGRGRGTRWRRPEVGSP